MDPRSLLGLGARAGRAEVRAAHRRLRRAVDPGRGGTVALVTLVDTAAGVLLGTAAPRSSVASSAAGGAGAVLTVPDPRRLLGVAFGAGGEEIHAAYRRVARVVHPDLGGTDELFRLVESAHRALLDTPVWGGGPAPAWRPPPPPPPRGPYRAPPPEERHLVPPWRAWRDLAWCSSILAGGALVVAGAFSIGSALGGIALTAYLLAVTLRVPVVRPAVEGALRAGIVLLGARVRVPDAVAPERFLEVSCLDAPVGRVDEVLLYESYVRWCERGGRGQPVAPWVFVERLRTLGLLLVKPSAWAHGLWVGLTLVRP